MNSIVDFVLKNKLAVWIITIVLIFSGFYSGVKMKMESLPNVDIPFLIVSTVYPGGSPDKIDVEVSTKILDRLEDIEGLLNISSNSSQNVSIVNLEFDYGVDMVKAKVDVEKELNKIDFDESIITPEVLQISMDSLPVLSMGIHGDNLDKYSLTRLIERSLQEDLKDIKGVSDLILSGSVHKEIQMNFKTDVMSEYGLSEESVLQLIKANNIDISLGLVEFENSKESVVVKGLKTNFNDFNNMKFPFLNNKGNNIVLSDIADVKLVEVNESISRINGKDSISLSILKSQESNTVEVVNNVKKVVEDFLKDNKDINVSYVLDQGEPIEESVKTMLSKALFGALAAVFIIMLFLRNIRSTLISIVSIPLSILISMSILNYIGVTLNIMTLGAMTVAIGRVIDDSIVVVENIYRRLYLENEKLKGRALIKEATIEMFVPIFSSTMVTIAVFLPLILVGGMVGELFLPFALTMIFSLLASLLVSITVVPVMAHTGFRKELKGVKGGKKEKESKVTKSYVRALEWCLNHKVITIVLSMSLVIGSLVLIPKIGFEFMPEEDNFNMTLEHVPKNGDVEKVIEDDLLKTEKFLNDKEEVNFVQLTLGGSSNFMMGGSSNGKINIEFNDNLFKDTNFKDYKESMIKEVNNLGLSGNWNEGTSGAPGGMGGNKLEYNIYGLSLEDVTDASEKVVSILGSKSELENVESSLSSVYDEKVLVVDEDKASVYGLTTAQVGMSLMNISNDIEVTTLNEKGESYNVVIKGDKISYDSFEDVLNKDVLTLENGYSVKVRDVSIVENSSTVSSVEREGNNLVVKVSADLKVKDVRKISSDIDKELRDIEFNDGVSVKTGGVSAQMKDSFIQLGIAMLAAIAIVYLLLVLTFKEGLAPFVILFSLPMTVVGVVAALLVSGETLNISSMLGLLMLIGIVVTNAIILVDRILINEYGGKDMRSSILEASKTRVRPILMTALATIGALIPLVIGAEGGGLISKGLGITVIGGLLSSTVLTLFIVPVVYELLSKIFKKDRKNIDIN